MTNHKGRIAQGKNERAISDSIARHYARPGNSVGGCLHVVLDDGNLEDYFVLHAIGRAIDDLDIDAASLACAILCLPRPRRRRALKAAMAAMNAGEITRLSLTTNSSPFSTRLRVCHD